MDTGIDSTGSSSGGVSSSGVSAAGNSGAGNSGAGVSGPALRLTTVNVSAPDPGALARFYQRLLGFEIVRAESDDVLLRDPAGGCGISVQSERDYVPPAWPGGPGDQRMMMHLEIQVDDLATAASYAVECGATLADEQPQDDVRVCLDPAGHPFCLWTMP